MTVVREPPLVSAAGAHPLGADAPACPAPHHRAACAAVAVAVTLLATALVLSLRLPDTAVAQNWSLAWAGLDVATAVAALATAALLRAGDRRAALAAAAGSALLVIDAWFDVCTSTPGLARTVAVAEAVLLELPFSVLAGRLALRLLTPASPAGDERAGPRERGSVIVPDRSA